MSEWLTVKILFVFFDVNVTFASQRVYAHRYFIAGYALVSTEIIYITSITSTSFFYASNVADELQ